MKHYEMMMSVSEYYIPREFRQFDIDKCEIFFKKRIRYLGVLRGTFRRH